MMRRLGPWLRRLLPIAFWLAAFAYTTHVVLYVTGAPGPEVVPPDQYEQRFGLHISMRQRIFQEMADADERLWRESQRLFRNDVWSQHDHYHNLFGNLVGDLTRKYDLHRSIVFLIYDEGLRNHWSSGDGHAMTATWTPLRPRIQ